MSNPTKKRSADKRTSSDSSNNGDTRDDAEEPTKKAKKLPSAERGEDNHLLMKSPDLQVTLLTPPLCRGIRGIGELIVVAFMQRLAYSYIAPITRETEGRFGWEMVASHLTAMTYLRISPRHLSQSQFALRGRLKEERLTEGEAKVIAARIVKNTIPRCDSLSDLSSIQISKTLPKMLSVMVAFAADKLCVSTDPLRTESLRVFREIADLSIADRVGGTGGGGDTGSGGGCNPRGGRGNGDGNDSGTDTDSIQAVSDADSGDDEQSTKENKKGKEKGAPQPPVPARSDTVVRAGFADFARSFAHTSDCDPLFLQVLGDASASVAGPRYNRKTGPSAAALAKANEVVNKNQLVSDLLAPINSVCRLLQAVPFQWLILLRVNCVTVGSAPQ
jgi:hypothetical protein